MDGYYMDKLTNETISSNLTNNIDYTTYLTDITDSVYNSTSQDDFNSTESLTNATTIMSNFTTTNDILFSTTEVFSINNLLIVKIFFYSTSFFKSTKTPLGTITILNIVFGCISTSVFLFFVGAYFVRKHKRGRTKFIPSTYEL